MNSAISHQVAIIQRLAKRAGQVISECNEATRRVTTLVGTPDLYRAPDNDTEFLIRTAGVLRCQPERITLVRTPAGKS